LLLLDRVFSELFETNFYPSFFTGVEIGLKLVLIHTRERLVGAFWK